MSKFNEPLYLARSFLWLLYYANCPAEIPIPSSLSFENQECLRAYVAVILTSGSSAKSFRARSLAGGEIFSH